MEKYFLTQIKINVQCLITDMAGRVTDSIVDNRTKVEVPVEG